MESWINNTRNTAVLTFSSTKLLNERPDGNRLSSWGTSHLLLYLSILIDLQEKKLSPDQKIIFPKRVAQEKSALRSTRADVGEERTLMDVLNQAVSLNAPDCIFALMQVYGSQQGARKKIDFWGRKLNISRSSRASLTGRLHKTQSSNLFDYYKIANAYLTLARSSFSYIRNRVHVLKGKTYFPQSTLDLKGDTIASIFWGKDQNDCLVFKEMGGDLYCSLVINGESYVHTSEVAFAPFVEAAAKPDEITLENPVINILADTYFGEYQTEVRKRKKRTDALQKFGYHYSFQRIAEKISPEEYNIITYEGVLIKPEEECFNKRKVFYLGGNKEKTIEELKKRHIQLANLGNNHAKDYGDEALLETVEEFNQNGISTVGAGKNLNDAMKPVILNYQEERIAIFAGYWHRTGRDRDFDFYATSRSGVAALNGSLLERIELFKKENPEIFVVVLAHWGVDFVNLSPRQKQLAQRLVAKGADLIIGSGPHKIQEIEVIDGVVVFYSIGNGIFNSDGKEFSNPGNLPYSYLLKWHLADKKLRIYPFWNYNLDNFWQPYFVEAHDQEQVMTDLVQLNHHALFDHPKWDEAGHLYYETAVTSRVKEKSSQKLDAEWFKKNLKGKFLENQLPDFDFDYITISPKNFANVSFEKALFISLSPNDLKSLFYKKGWEPEHRNQELVKAGIPERFALIITDQPIEEYRGKVPQFIVENSIEAASVLANCICEAYRGKMITITGSAGKSSVRMILEHLLAGENVLSNTGNSNVHVPLLELALNLATQPETAIFEVSVAGMNFFANGNEAYRYRSDIAIVTSFGMAHTTQGIGYNLSRKSEIFYSVKNGGTAIINGDMEERYLWKFVRQARRQNLKIKLYSLSDHQAYCYLLAKKVGRDSTDIVVSLGGKEINFSLTTDSDGQIQNTMAALIALETSGYEVAQYTHLLSDYRSLPRILEHVTLREAQVTMIDDTHNSSVLALTNGLQIFKEKSEFYQGNKLLVLGEIADLGNYSLQAHQQFKTTLENCAATQIFLHGESFEQVAKELPHTQWFEDKEDIASAVTPYLNEDALVFVKGSASAKFYTVADQLKKI